MASVRPHMWYIWGLPCHGGRFFGDESGLENLQVRRQKEEKA